MSIFTLPKISVIVPAFNTESTLRLCLDSLAKLDYPFENLEVILVDNGSTDATLDIARAYNVTVLSEPTIKSSYAARNKGILAAQGELIAFTDADCIVTPGWLKHLVEDWEDQKIGCFAGEIEAYQPESLVEKFSDRAGILRQRCTLECPYMPYPQTANAAYRKSVFDQVGLFVPEMTSGGDADIAWRMQKKLGLTIKYVPEALVYHKHRTSIQGLYNQFIKYEYGKYYWTKHYPDYEFPSLGQRQEELLNSIQHHCNALKSDVVSLANDEVDFVDFVSSFLKTIMCAGTFKARVDIERSLGNVLELQQVNNEYHTTVDELSKIASDRNAVIAEKEAIIKEKDDAITNLNELIAKINESLSWKSTSPPR